MVVTIYKSGPSMFPTIRNMFPSSPPRGLANLSEPF
jgi:hypothetical protein